MVSTELMPWGGKFSMVPSSFAALAGGFGPHVALSETDQEVKLVAELPGLDEKDLELTLQDGVLTLRGEQTRTAGAARWHGQFQRSFRLGAEIDPDSIAAVFRNGLLTVTVARKAQPPAELTRIPIAAC